MSTGKFTAPTNRSSGISSATINNGAGALGSEIDNETNKDKYAALQLVATHGSAPAAGAPWYVYFVTADDGTNYEDGGAATMPARPPDAVILMRNVTSSQRASALEIVQLKPVKLKPLAWNAAGQNATGVTLNIETFNDDIA